MAEQTSNHDWTIPTVGEDTNTWGQILNDFFDGELDEQVTLEGPYSERPSAADGNVKLYLATDRKIVYYNDGSSWEAVYGLGTDSNPVPGTSHFESVNTGTLKTTDRSWQSLSGSRSLNTWHQAPDYDIDFGLTLQTSADDTTIDLIIDINPEQSNNKMFGFLQFNKPSGSEEIIGPFEVPANHYYQIRAFGNSTDYSIVEWGELR